MVLDIVYSTDYDVVPRNMANDRISHGDIDRQPSVPEALTESAQPSNEAEKEKESTAEEQGQQQDTENMLDFYISRKAQIRMVALGR